MRVFLAMLLVALLPSTIAAQAQTTTGPIVPSFGPVYAVTPDFATPSDIDYSVAFEAASTSSPTRLNSVLTSAARFLNMHGQAGISRERLGAAVVVHGSAVQDVLSDAAYQQRHDAPNPNAALIRELLDAGVQVVVCGQSAASRGVAAEELMDGVQMALSAMTAFVVLQDQGYRVNPW